MAGRDTLIDLRLRDILEHDQLSENVKEKLDILRNELTETQETLHEAHSGLENDDDMKTLINRDYEKPGTDMGEFCISFIETSNPLVKNLDACHVTNRQEHISSTCMLHGQMAYNNPN